MSSISSKLAVILLLVPFAVGQNAVNLDTGVKGSRLPMWSSDSGAANAYVLTTIAPLGPTLRTGSSFTFAAAHTNTGASTANVDSTGVINIKKYSSGTLSALGAGDITAGQIVILWYDGTQYQCVTCSGGAGGGSGTVTSFSAGNLSPLFTTSVATATTTPALSFSLSNAAAHTFFGNNTGSSSAPAFATIGTADLPGSGATTVNSQTCTLGSTCTIPLVSSFSGDGTFISNSGSTGAVTATLANASAYTIWGRHAATSGAPSYAAVDLAHEVTGVLPVANGGNGTSSPTLTAGTNVSLSGSWPNYTISATSSGGGTTIVGATPYAIPVYASSTIPYNGMLMWFDASCPILTDGSTCSTPANGSSLGLWVDRSGHWIYGIQSGSASTFNTGQINGQPAITLNGSFKLSSEQSGNKAMTHFSGAVTMFAVVKASSNSANNPIIGGGQSDWEWRISTSKLQEVLQEQIASLGTSTTAANTSWHQLNFTCTVNSLISSSLNPIFRTDGASDATLSGAACNNIAQDVTKGFTNIGGAPAVAEQFSGQIAEFIAYGRVLSSTEIAQVEAYFHAKYGL